MSLCGETCKEMKISFGEYKEKFCESAEKTPTYIDRRCEEGKNKTHSAKAALLSLNVGEKLKLICKKKIIAVEIISKNDSLITVRDGNGRIDTVHVADVITGEIKLCKVG